MLVYDLGGGTFDSTLLEISRQGYRTLATDGDVKLGGYDWDMRLVDLASERFIGRFREDPRANAVSLQRLLREVEQAKRTLSARSRAVVRVEHVGSHLETEVTRTEFEEATADLLERTAYTTQELLNTAGLQWSEVDRILLVGGATRMPMVARMLRDLSGQAPQSTVSPDEAVARGAAVYAGYLLNSRSDSPPKFRITHVNAHNLGVRSPAGHGTARERCRDSTQHAASGQGHPQVRHAKTGPAHHCHPSARGGEFATGRVPDAGTSRHQRPASRSAGRVSGACDLRVRGQCVLARSGQRARRGPASTD